MDIINDTSNLGLVLKLKAMDADTLATLCKMHLSVILDLNDDQFTSFLEGIPKSEDKQKKGFPYFTKKQKYKRVMEGAPLSQEGICQVYQLIKYLERDFNICQEGLFRKTGSLMRQQELKNLLNLGYTVDLDSGQFSVHDCASVLKNFLSELPEPLLSNAHFQLHQRIPDIFQDSPNQSNAHQNYLTTIQLLFFLLPYENLILLRDVLTLLHKVTLARINNCMDASALATLFAPHILFPRMYSLEVLQNNFTKLVKAVTFMIENSPQIFEPSGSFMKDIRTYFKNHISFRQASSEAIKTNINFCERSTDEAYKETSKSYTEKAIADLYRYVQTMPESSPKRKFMKQVNKENTFFTPIKRVENKSNKKHHRSRTFGDSIKKHFGKNLQSLHQTKDDLNIPCPKFTSYMTPEPDLPSKKNLNSKNRYKNSDLTNSAKQKLPGTPLSRTMARASKRMKAAVLTSKYRNSSTPCK